MLHWSAGWTLPVVNCKCQKGVPCTSRPVSPSCGCTSALKSPERPRSTQCPLRLESCCRHSFPISAWLARRFARLRWTCSCQASEGRAGPRPFWVRLTYTVMSIHLRSPFSVVFLLHLALEMPIAIQGVWQPISLPFLQLNNTTLVFLKLYSALLLASCIVSGLCFSLPEFMPGKRALAIGLCIYHSIASTILFQAPRFIPYSFGPFMEQQRITPEIVWGICHGILGLGMVVWWQATVQLAAMARASGPPQG